MNPIKINWKRLSISLFLIALTLASYTAYRTFATPSGQTSSIEGGGFCQGTYTVYNNTIDKLLYAENCTTGVNDFSASSDLGSLLTTSVIPAMTSGGTISLRAGLFNVVTTIIIANQCGNLCELNMVIQGAGPGSWSFSLTNPTQFNGTLLIAKTAGMTMLESTSSVGSVTCTAAAGCTGAPRIRGVTIENLGLCSCSKAAIGINFAMAEVAALNRFVNLRLGGIINTANSGFTTAAMILDGGEDTLVSSVFFDGDGTPTTDGTNVLDLQWNAPLGNIQIIGSFFGGKTSLSWSAQTTTITGGTVTTLFHITDAGNPFQEALYLNGVYMGNPRAGAYGPGTIQLNGKTITTMRFASDFITTSSAQTFFSGTGTVDTYSFSGCTFQFVAGASLWNPGGATLTNARSNTDNWVSGGTTPTGFPFTITSQNF